MKKNFLTAVGLALTAFATPLYGCGEDHDDDRVNVPQNVLLSFAAQFPDARRVEWDYEHSAGCYEAEFRLGSDAKAWFDPSGSWRMTKTELSFRSLPQAVADAHRAGAHARWRVEEVQLIERRDYDPVYMIEVEEGPQEADLVYTADGVLVKTYWDFDTDHYLRPDPAEHDAVLAQIRRDVAARHPQARIVEIDQNTGGFEVDIVEGRVERELLFDTQARWLSTTTEDAVLPAHLAEAVKAQYASYRIDDVDHVLRPQGVSYIVELEKHGRPDVTIVVGADGSVGPYVR